MMYVGERRRVLEGKREKLARIGVRVGNIYTLISNMYYYYPFVVG